MERREMTKLFRPFRSQFTEQLNGIDLDDIPIFKREGSLCQQDVKGLAGSDYIRARWRGQSALETCRPLALELEFNDQGDSTGNYVCIVCGESAAQRSRAA